jgi:hypothetical protein
MATPRRRLFKLTTSDMLQMKQVSITVAMGAATGSSAADPDLVDGIILGVYPVSGNDQVMADVTVNANGSVTINTAAVETAATVFYVNVIAPN